MVLILVVFQGPRGIATLDTLKKWGRSSVGYRRSTVQELGVKTRIDLILAFPVGDSPFLPRNLPDQLHLLLLYTRLKVSFPHESFSSPPPASSLFFHLVELILFGSVILYLTL